MSFGNTGPPPMKKFVSQEQIDERRRQRQEEWEKVRTPDQPLDCPEEEVSKCLYDQLQEQKEKKQQEYEEQHRLKNSIKGLEQEETEFLDFVSERQIELEQQRKKEEQDLFRELREAATTTSAVNQSDASKKSLQRPIQSTSGRPSQQALLMNAVKRKRSSSPDSTSNTVEDADKEEISTGSPSNGKDSSTVSSQSVPPQVAHVLGVLPGIGAYSDDSTASDSDSSDSSEPEDFFAPSLMKLKMELYQAASGSH